MDAIILRHKVEKWLGNNNFLFSKGEIYISAFDEMRSMVRWKDIRNRICISFLKENLNILSNEKISFIKGNKILQESALWKKNFVREHQYVCYFDSFSSIRNKILDVYKRDKAFIEYDPELDKHVIEISFEKTDYYYQRRYYILQSKSKSEDQGFIEYISICSFLSSQGSADSCTINLFLSDEKDPLNIIFQEKNGVIKDFYTKQDDIDGAQSKFRFASSLFCLESLSCFAQQRLVAPQTPKQDFEDFDNYTISTIPSYDIEILKLFSNEEIYEFFNKNISLHKEEPIICHITQSIIRKLSMFEINQYLI